MASEVEQVKEIAADLKQLVNKANEQALLSIEEKGKAIDAALKSEIANALEADRALRQKEMDQFQTDLKKMGGFGGEKQESFSDILTKGIAENKESIRSKRTFELEFDQKAVGDMMVSSTNNHLAAGIIEPTRAVGIILRQEYFNHVRDFMTVRPTSSPVVTYVQENGGEGSFATVAEGALKPQIDYDLTLRTANITKIAAHLRLSEELIEDVPYITNYVTTRGSEDLRLVEDAQLLYGDGVGTNIRGLNLDAAAFARPAGIGTITNASIVEILRVALAQIRIGRFRATAILLNPIDIALLELTKDSTGQPLITPANAYNPVRTLWGIAVVETDTVTAGSFFLGDFANGAELLDRRALSVRFYDQDRDNAIRNMVTIVIEERIGLATIRPASFVRGTFAAARTALAAA